ncbi:MAG: 3-hydroxyacyl-ACP dehydratase FabZ, partial [Cetobacterium sp.]
MLDVMEIMKRIPHRYPFLLVDRILEMDKEALKIVGLKNVTINEEFFNGHFPGHPIMPGVLIVEGIAQCLGVLVLDDTGEKVPYFAAIENVKFKAP